MLASLTVPLVHTAPPLSAGAPAASWRSGAAVSLRWDVAHATEAAEPTTVHIATDGTFLYVRFDAVQREPIAASQHSNDVVTGGSNGNGGNISWSNDDAVWIDLWPNGPGGFEYQFEANPNGSHNESSSENADFAPHWESRGASDGNGYRVTMAVPLGVIHGAHAGTWRMQFIRYVHATGAIDVWSYDTAQTMADDPARAGDATIPLARQAPLPKPRVSIYGLGAIDSKEIGGSTSRTGADFSFPVSETAAIFGTVHPDYSNVELDQQSISPSVYQRIYGEVRPFFTQAASFYNDFNCSVCSGYRTTLYTPAIPTPREGYAFEGRQGDFGLAAFDAIGARRTDAASALNYTSPDTHWNVAFQHVTADVPGSVDDANQGGVSWWNGKHLSFYANYATDRGTLVQGPADWLDAGGGWGDQHVALYGSVRKVGAYFNPVDGFDSHPGIAGYGLYAARVWMFSPNDLLSSAGADFIIDRYHGALLGIAQSDTSVLVDVLTKKAIDLQLYSGSDYWRFGSVLEPISQNGGFSITYHSGTQNNLNNFPQHGASATPTSIQYNTGRYGNGRLDTWYRSSTMRVGDRGSLTLTIDDTAQWLPHAPANVQWFDGLSYAYQIAPNSAFAVGVRRVTGFPPLPNGGGNCEGVCSNVSFAYHLRLNDEEFYLAYGDPNALVTAPQAIFKVIFYAGGQKGT
jgi:hypothetical protein